MSRDEMLANAIQALQRELAAPPSVDDELRAVATFASIALALLALFTNARRETLKRDEEAGLRKWSKGGSKAAIVDLAIVLVTVAVVATMTPALSRSISLFEWFDRDHALSSMFAIVYAGFVGILLWQGRIVWTRLTA